MTSLNTYTFHNTGRIGADSTDETQRSVSNTHFTNHMLTNYFSSNSSDAHVKFAIQQPTLSFSGLANGNGISGSSVDDESILQIKTDQARPLEKLQLFQRPFATVPYLGRGSRDPALESRLMQGENVCDKKSVSTIMEKSFAQYALYPTDDKMKKESSDASTRVEEAAMDGWVRGGTSTREMSVDEQMRHSGRPNSGAF